MRRGLPRLGPQRPLTLAWDMGSEKRLLGPCLAFHLGEGNRSLFRPPGQSQTQAEVVPPPLSGWLLASLFTVLASACPSRRERKTMVGC